MPQGQNIVIILTSVLLLPALLLWYFLGSSYRTKEPNSALFAAIGFGILAVAIAYPLERLLIPDNAQLSSLLAGPSIMVAFRASLMVALIEESVKFFPAAFFFLRRSYFRGPAEGVIYFAVVGLSFGVIENIIYVSQYGGEGGVSRMLVLGFFHAATAALVGYYLGLVKIKKASMASALSALAVVVLLHSIYDTGILVGSSVSTMIALSISLGLNCLLFVLYSSARKLK